jgi:hypothetical protein
LDRHRDANVRRECRQAVIAGLDPAIHLLLKKLLRRTMDARIKSGHDEMRRHGQLLPKFKIGIWRNGRCPSLLVKRSA